MTYDCMTADELALWRVRGVRGGGGNPCVDCPLAFRVEEIAAGRCCRTELGQVNGRPRLASPDYGIERRRQQWRDAQRRRRPAE